MNVKIKGNEVSGSVRAPPSKSYTQRAVACALIADGRTEIIDPSHCEDARAALNAAKMLGAGVEEGYDKWVIEGGSLRTPEDIIDCKGSATAIRIFTAVSALAPGITVLTGDRSLRRRPMGELLRCLNSLGVSCYSTRGDGCPPVVVMGGGIEGGEVNLRGDISSQFISALLIASTKAKKDTVLNITTPIASKYYVDMTMEVLRAFGATIVREDRVFHIKGGQRLTPCNFRVEGDYSLGAILLAAGLLAGNVGVEGLMPNSTQGDRKVIEIFSQMGGEVYMQGRTWRAKRSKLYGLVLDMSDVPDLVPITAVLGSQASGTTIIKGIRRLRFKESDRVLTTTNMLRAFGVEVKAYEDFMVIQGGTPLRATVIDPSNDHRIAMASAVASLVAQGETIIQNAECVSKSYPSFFNDLRTLGATVEVF